MMKGLCYQMLKSSGWTFDVNLPDTLRSFIMLGVPHTSNFDFFPAMAIGHVMGRNAKFVIKNDWVKFPMSLVMKPLGAIGLDREKLKEGKGSNTDIMAGLFKDFSELVLMIAPEGTRKATENWKTGFYYIAQKANVPIVCAYADYSKKIIGTGPIIYPGVFEADMKTIMDFYKNISGRQVANFRLDSRYK
jgi:1-acyl-sn-glycerol-3-phosphate acyltransferase